MNWKLNLAVLWFGNFLVMAGMTMITPFLPLYVQELGVTDTHQVAMWSSFIFAGSFVSSFFFQPLWGKLADKHGRKVMLIRSSLGMTIVISLMGLATHPWQLFALRLLNGTVAGFNPAAIALVSATTPKERMGFAMGILQSGFVAGTILGPLFGGLLEVWIGFRYIFFLTGGLLFAAMLLTAAVVKESFDVQAARKQPNMSILENFRLLSSVPQLKALFTVTILLQFAMLSPQSLLPLFVQRLIGPGEYVAFFAGLVGSVTGISNLIASPILGRISDQHGAQKVLMFCLLGAGLVFIPHAFVTSVWQLLLCRFFLGMCIGGLLPSVNSLIRRYTPDGMESRSFSMNSSALALGNMLGPILGGALSGPLGIRGIFIMTGSLMLLNMLWVRRTLVGRPDNAEA
ncbi:MFS transporter [Paenibacillus sp. y28]|uniref:MFS transporter n=1 Tax=Paenibacillus sp. y28 TaxID=3129110 RepID=UPI00301AFFA7